MFLIDVTMLREMWVLVFYLRSLSLQSLSTGAPLSAVVVILLPSSVSRLLFLVLLSHSGALPRRRA